MADSRTTWVVAYINRDFIKIANEELIEYNYKNVEAYIPTIKLLKKQFKGKQLFEFVPLLFNYGFFKMPYKDACNPEFLLELRHRISCIYAWVKDPASSIPNMDPRLTVKNTNSNDAVPRAAIATDQEVANMIKASQSMSIFTQDDLKQFKAGDYIKLEGYPFEGLPAEILKIDYKKGVVIIKLEMASLAKEISVSFENVFYSIYKNYDEESREESTESLQHRYGENAIDHITFKKRMV